MTHRWLYRLIVVASIFALFVVVLGAYTRLTHAGLGCPDWPGCYGRIAPVANASPVIETGKAWTEMVHRYCAGILATLILIIAVSSVYARLKKPVPVIIPILLVFLVVGQATLGMWTVTLKLYPPVVMGHLLGGMMILALLWTLRLQSNASARYTLTSDARAYRRPVMLALLLVAVQIALGGWVSANYAGLACIGFPKCNGIWWPHFAGSDLLTLGSIGPNYQGGVHAIGVRISIQMAHRIMAVVTAAYLLALCTWMIMRAREKKLRSVARVVILLICTQFILGVVNVTHLLPLANAVAHNATAAILLLSVVTLCYYATVKVRHHP